MEHELFDKQSRSADAGMSAWAGHDPDAERAYLAAIIESSTDAIIAMGMDGLIRTWNAAAERLFGYRPEEVIGKPITLLLPSDRVEEEQHILDRLRRGERIEHLDTVRLDRDGRRVDVSITISPLKDRSGRIIGASRIVRDIHDLKLAREQVRLQAAALEAAANGIAITDASGAILWVNPAFCELTGYTAEELAGKNPRILRSSRQDDAFYRTMWDTIRRGEIWHGELVNRRKNGSEYVEEMTISPVRDRQGTIVHFIAVKQDVSLRRAEQEALAAAKVSAERAKASAEEATRAKDQFLAVLSHELRTPLAPVVTAVSMLQDEVHGDDGSREALDMIRRNVEMEARLIDDLLDVTRIVRGKVELDRRPIPLGKVIQRAVEVCKEDLETRQLHFGVDVGNARGVHVDADPARLQQVFWNLLKNAVKFTPNGGSVRIRCHTEGEMVVTEVIDSGEGIEPHLLPHIFNPFEQGGARVTRQFGGLGLGLTITKGVVELHGGTVTARSEGKGKGATFTVCLPIASRQAAKGRCGAGRDTSARATSTIPSRPLRILLVEDHRDTANVMRRLLVSHGHQVQLAGDVATALELAAAEPFDLLLSDLGLPDGSGVDLMSQLRKQGRSWPAIALSGYGQEEDIRRSKEAGFTAHLTKPVNPGQLVATIGSVMK